MINSIQRLCQRKLASSLLVFFFIFFMPNLWAQTTSARPYKISILIFKHLPADKDFSANHLTLWSNNAIINSIDVNDNLLAARESALAGAYYALSRDSSYQILYHAAWLASFQNGESRLFHFYKDFENSGEKLDGLIKITLKYYLDVDVKTQLLSPSAFGSIHFYHITALDEIYQTPSNQLHYIDSPNYGALILITKAN